jgi:hypothetical protein
MMKEILFLNESMIRCKRKPELPRDQKATDGLADA